MKFKHMGSKQKVRHIAWISFCVSWFGFIAFGLSDVFDSIAYRSNRLPAVALFMLVVTIVFFLWMKSDAVHKTSATIAELERENKKLSDMLDTAYERIDELRDRVS